ncbi:PKD-like family lipoprotein [Mucilaginibacter sp. dw_454]|uniref:PKD-like family lipoprotein n=1 Tax=Mucilaginibacter sp. dw_454 TaxID=2720079 RepID=UPI001BD273A5|nr:PKD-like family lipoprotein [Mucilaginibacter sp. dw_454]
MRNKLYFLLIFLAGTLFSCKKDLGNYTYHTPSEPILTAFTDSTFNALVGDTLTLAPKVTIAGANYLTDLSYQWDILVAEEARTETFTGYPLKFVYNLAPQLRDAKLTITDKRNGIKYFFQFKILGGTQFSTGTTVLSVDNGITKLSFIKPDNSVISNLYKSLNGEDLPVTPTQLFAKPLAYQPGSVENYWVICQDPANPGVVIDGSTMLRKNYFKDQFFIAPPTINLGSFEASNGTPTAEINGKLYLSVTQTAPFAPDFGKFSSAQSGDYTLSKFYTRTPSYFFGFDATAQSFITFDGGGNYMGNDFATDGSAFDAKHIGTSNMLFMQAQPGQSYAYIKGTDGKIYELSFYIDMDDYSQRSIHIYGKREFKGEAFVTDDTKWQKSTVDIFYFTSNDKIYRYNPLNQDLRTLDANMNGNKVTMIKLSADGNTLTAGTNGSLYTLDVSVGKNGTITKTINGIPGSPVDMVIR